MPQWEYRKINLNDVPRKSDDIDLLTDAGEQGWELIAITPNNIAYMKRSIEESASIQVAPQAARSTRRKAPANPPTAFRDVPAPCPA
jgi:hypothetical protein